MNAPNLINLKMAHADDLITISSSKIELRGGDKTGIEIIDNTLIHQSPSILQQPITTTITSDPQLDPLLCSRNEIPPRRKIIKGRLSSTSDQLVDSLIPCQRIRPWSYKNCFGYYDGITHTACQFVNFVDIEDFMNNEKRKEKSRDAARCRRSRETEIFTELAGALPLSKDTISQLDKASVMRLAISYLKIRNIVDILPECQPSKEMSEADKESVFLKALEGFMIVVSDEGDIVYLSENVSDFLGITQVDLMGQNIYEYSHPCDHDEVRDILTTKSSSDKKEMPTKSFFLRLKCTLTSNGRSVNLKSATYKVIHFIGHILPEVNEDEEIDTKPATGADTKTDQNSSTLSSQQQKCLIAIGQPIPHPSNIEIPLDKKTFLSKHSLDMKFTYADEKMSEVLGFEPEELIGKSVYNYYHALDSDIICSGFKSLFAKGQCETSRYRFLAKCGGYVWVVSQATVLHDKFRKPQSVVCVHHVISGLESQDEILSISQHLAVTSKQTNENKSSTKPSVVNKEIETIKPPVTVVALEQEIKDKVILKESKENIPSITLTPAPLSVTKKSSKSSSVATSKIKQEDKVKQENKYSDFTGVLTASPQPRSVTDSVFVKPEHPQTATSKIFAPRTEDMNKGFLMFSDEEPGLTILKDEPDDLTHLAPTAGDVCVPLADNIFFSDMLDDFILSENCSLLTDDLASLDSSQSSNKTSSTNSITDPFMVYRDDLDLCKSEISNSPQLLSPAQSQSPGGGSLPSLCSPGNSFSEDDQIASFIQLQMDSEDEQSFSKKDTYVSVNMGDGLPLLNVSEDLMWGALPDNKLTLRQNKNSSSTSPQLNSSLAQLLCQKTNITHRTSTYKANDHGGGLINMSDLLYQKFSSNKDGSTDRWILDDSNSITNINKSPPDPTPSSVKNKNIKLSSIGGGGGAQKRVNSNSHNQYETITKRCKNEPAEKLSSELLNQLMSNTTPSRRSNASQSKQKSDWHNSKTDPPPSDSVLMNLLDNIKKDPDPSVMDTSPPLLIINDTADKVPLPNISVLLGNHRASTGVVTTSSSPTPPLPLIVDTNTKQRRGMSSIRKNSFSLLDPEGRTIPSLMDLSEQDYEVNAPVNNTPLLQGYELLNALECSNPMMMC